jgi:hypothetical protein
VKPPKVMLNLAGFTTRAPAGAIEIEVPHAGKAVV